MSVNVCIHIENEEVKMELADEQSLNDDNPYRTLCIGPNTTIFLTDKQARQLCEELEKKLYDAPTYEELNNTCDMLSGKVMDLEEKILELKEEPYSPEEYDLNYSE